MYTEQPKKMMIINILDILRKHSDENHRLSQQDIVRILKTDYGMKAGRKAVRRNIMDLMDFGYEIEHTESVRMVKNKRTGEKEESSVWCDYYLVRDFTDSELRLLIDSVMFSRYIPVGQGRKIVDKLEKLSSRHFHSRIRHISVLSDPTPQNKQLFLTIEALDEAITHGKKVQFCYNEYGTDKVFHPKLNHEGVPRRYTVSPYQMVAANGRYYLISNTGKYMNVSHYRLDRITDITVLDEDSKPMKSIEGLAQGLNLPRHLTEHLNMFVGESAQVTFAFKRSFINEIIDSFGSDVLFSTETDEEITATVYVNLRAMEAWATQYLDKVHIITPDSLVDSIRRKLRAGLEMYE